MNRRSQGLSEFIRGYLALQLVDRYTLSPPQFLSAGFARIIVSLPA
jgi:hypothetical protein